MIGLVLKGATVPVEASRVVGRRDLVSQVVALLEAPGSVVTLVGEAGIGKTTVFEQALAAREVGWSWSCQCREAEAELGLAMLADLFAAAPAIDVATLPGPQRRALDAVLYRDTADLADPIGDRLLGATTLSLLRAGAARGPVQLGVDDLQWCDPTSFAALDYAIHRLGEHRVAVLATCRPGGGRELVRSHRLDVPPLPEAAIAEVIRDVLGSRAGEASSNEVVARSAGNPFFARELARVAIDGSAGGLPSSVRQLLRDRLVTIGPATRSTLLDAAVRGALETGEHGAIGLAEALDAELLVVVEGRVQFSHPLLASAVLEMASAEDVVAAHRRAADAAGDPITRALHRARCTPASDDLAAELDEATAIALHRGDVAGARLLARLAVELTPDRPTPTSRLLRLCELEGALGDYERAVGLAEQILGLDPTPHEWAQAMIMIADDRFLDDTSAALECYRQVAALDGVPEADRQLAVCEIATVLSESGRYGEAISELEQFINGLPAVTADHDDAVGNLVLIRRLSGIPDDEILLRRVIEDGRRTEGGFGTVTSAAFAVEVAGIVATLADRHDEARRLLTQAEQSAARLGEKDFAGYFNGLLACRTGDLVEAERRIRRTLATDGPNPLAWARLALVSAWLGNAEQALEQVAQARSIQTTPLWHRPAAEASFAAALVDLLAGRYDAAWPVLRATAELLDTVGYREPSHPAVLPAAVEAAAAVGELDAAHSLCERLERDSASLDSRFGAAAARRSRGFIAAARGDRDAAEACFADAVARFTASGLRLEAARSELALGALLRRAGQRRRARETLTAAQQNFAACGARTLLRDVETELGRISGRSAAAPTELTESERQVADLVARGLRNADVAQTMHLSVKTVETHLGHIYRKLEVRSRSEMVAVLNRRTGR